MISDLTQTFKFVLYLTSSSIVSTLLYTSRLYKKETGSGIAKGDTSNGFPGNYIVTYIYPCGSEAGTFDLKIEKNGPIYDLTYHKDGELLFVGVGIETSDGLTTGFRMTE